MKIHLSKMILFFFILFLHSLGQATNHCKDLFEQEGPHLIQVPSQKIQKILFDMDGVLVNDAQGLADHHGISVEDFYHRRQAMKEIDPGFNYGVWLIQKYMKEAPLFENHPAMPYLEKIKQWIFLWQKQGISVEILSSVSSLKEFQTQIAIQKQRWLRQNNLDHLPTIFAQGSHDKRNYAQAGYLLIDDLPSNIHEFTQAGGDGIIHRSIEETELALKQRKLLDF